MRAVVLTLALLLLPASAWAAVGFDSSTSDAVFSSAATTYNFTGPTVVSGTNGYKILFVATDKNQLAVLSGVTYNGVAMTDLGERQTVAGNVSIQAWGVADTSTGAKTYALSGMDAGGTKNYMLCGAAFTGVHQTVPVGTVVTNNGVSDATSTVTVTTAANGMNAINVGVILQSPVAGSGVTAFTDGVACARSAAAVHHNAGRSTQDTNTFTFTADGWTTIGVPLQPVGTTPTAGRHSKPF